MGACALYSLKKSRAVGLFVFGATINRVKLEQDGLFIHLDEDDDIAKLHDELMCTCGHALKMHGSVLTRGANEVGWGLRTPGCILCNCLQLKLKPK